jgi:hypothetical protein
MKSVCKILPFLAFVWLLSACTIRTFDGPVVEKTVSVDAYESIHVKGPIDVVVDPDLKSDLLIEAPDDAMEFVTAGVRDDKLVLDFDANGIVSEGIKVRIAEDRLRMVRISGSGSFEGALSPVKTMELRIDGSGDLMANVETDELKVWVYGSGDVKCEGAAGDVGVNIKGSGDVDLRKVKARTAQASIAGSGDIKLNVSEELNAKISGSGDISYAGNPEKIEKSISGSGDIRAD